MCIRNWARKLRTIEFERNVNVAKFNYTGSPGIKTNPLPDLYSSISRCSVDRKLRYFNPSVSFPVEFDTLRRCKRLSILRTRSSLRSWHPSYPIARCTDYCRERNPSRDTRPCSRVSVATVNRRPQNFTGGLSYRTKQVGHPFYDPHVEYTRVSRYLRASSTPFSPSRFSLPSFRQSFRRAFGYRTRLISNGYS